MCNWSTRKRSLISGRGKGVRSRCRISRWINSTFSNSAEINFTINHFCEFCLVDARWFIRKVCTGINFAKLLPWSIPCACAVCSSNKLPSNWNIRTIFGVAHHFSEQSSCSTNMWVASKSSGRRFANAPVIYIYVSICYIHNANILTIFKVLLINSEMTELVGDRPAK